MTGADDRPTLRLIAFRPIGKAGLAGVADVELPALGLRLLSLPVFASGQTGPWCGLPRKPVLDRDHRQRTGADGKPVFEPLLQWTSREISDRFSAAVIAAVRRAHPDVLDADAEAEAPQPQQQQQQRARPRRNAHSRRRRLPALASTGDPVPALDDPVDDLWQEGDDR